MDLWIWIVIAVVIVAVGLALFRRARRSGDVLAAPTTGTSDR